MTDRAQLIEQVWACVEQAFVTGELERARALEHFLSVLEQLEYGGSGAGVGRDAGLAGA